MMSSKDRVGQIIKAFITVVTLITLTSRFCIIKAAFDHMLRLTRGTCNAIGPAQLTNGLITLHVIDEMLDVNLHDWTPVRDRKMGWRQYTLSSNATTLESKKSDFDFLPIESCKKKCVKKKHQLYTCITVFTEST